MATFSETMKEIDSLRHKKAVWEALIDHLERFAGDGVSEPEYQITADEAVEKTVPTEVIQQFIDDAMDKTKVLKKGIKEVEGSKVIPLEKETKETTNDNQSQSQNTNKSKKPKKKGLSLGKKGKKANKG